MIKIEQKNAEKLREDLFHTLKSAPNVTNVNWINKDKYEYSRDLEFMVSNTNYRIKWFWNESQLFFNGNCMVRFDRCELSGTWPNKYKYNLQFYLNGEVIAVVPVGEY